MDEPRIFNSAAEISAFVEERYQHHFADSANWLDAKIRAFHDLKDHTDAPDHHVQTSRHRKMIDLAFEVRGVEGARMIAEIPDTSETKAFETKFGDGSTYYHTAVAREAPIMLHALVNRITKTGDVDPDFINTQDKAGNSLLHTVARQSANMLLPDDKPFEDRVEMMNILIEDAGINPVLRDYSGEATGEKGKTSMGVLTDIARRYNDRKELFSSRKPWETDAHLDMIIKDAMAMHEAQSQILENQINKGEHGRRTGTYDEGHSAEVIDLDSYRRDR